MNIKKLLHRYILIIPIVFASVFMISWSDHTPALRNGYWHTTIYRPDGQQIVFNFLTKDSAGKKVMYVLNANEKLLVDSITMKDDSVYIQMPFFESSFRAAIDPSGNLNGVWIKSYGYREQVLPFKAVYNKKQRFSIKGSPKYTITGRWAVQFKGKDQEITPAVGEFHQKGSILYGTFLTASGDYRYLEGVVSGDSLKISGFDGGHAFLFTAAIKDSHHISSGKFYSGASSIESWEAVKNEKASLPDGYDQTHLREGEEKLNFSFTDLSGKKVSINDPEYKNKVVVVQLMGSWCPNCMDETSFLSDYYQKNRAKGVEVIALAYERTTDYEKSKTSLERFQKRFHVQYPMLVTGVTVSDPQKTEKTLPQLDNIKAFPTSIFIDKKGNVRKIYSGFEGPGTGAHFQEFQREFDETIHSLINE